MNFSIRELEKEEIENALLFVWKVFQEYEAPDYTQEGVNEFYQSIHDENYVSQLSLYGAFLQEKLAGVIATRNQGSHIALFFVDGTYHRQGIGRKLFETVLEKCDSDTITVNCQLDENRYEKGIKVSDSEFDSLRLVGDEFHPNWNYTISPLYD